jgi:Fe-Mn family superoxide dismutase
MKKLLLLLACATLNADFAAKDYTSLLGTPGFSNEALNMHFTLYNGYVKNSNLLLSDLAGLTASGQTKSPTFAELKRRFGWEFDGMRLHELYFENMGGKDPLAPDSPLAAQISKDFGSYDNWKADFMATGAMRGIGWAVLYYDPVSQRLFNTWINEHDLGHLAGGKPLLVMDVFEHAYLPDYHLERAKYIDAFFATINWPVVTNRLKI